MPDGLSIDAFGSRWNQDPEKFNKAVQKMAADKELNELQDEIEITVGIQIDLFNLYPLCAFVDAIVRECYFVFLKPTIKDTIAELKEAKEISILNTDYSKLTITNTKLLKTVTEAIKQTVDDNHHYETERLVRIDELTNNVVMQSKFAFWVATFLKQYFPDAKRRKNCCIVSEPEQRLILKMLSYFKLATSGVKLTTSRFRQMIAYYKTLELDYNVCSLPEIGTVHVTFVKYADWNKKDIDWTRPSLILHPLEKGDIICFTELKKGINCQNFSIINTNSFFFPHHFYTKHLCTIIMV